MSEEIKKEEEKPKEEIKTDEPPKENGESQEILKNIQTNLTPEERRRISEERMKAVMKDIRMEV